MDRERRASKSAPAQAKPAGMSTHVLSKRVYTHVSRKRAYSRKKDGRNENDSWNENEFEKGEDGSKKDENVRKLVKEFD